MSHILLIDGNSVAHANHNGTVLTCGDMQVQAIYGFLRSMRAMMDRFQGEREFIVLWDGRAQHRIDLYPEYKGNREALDDKAAAHKAAFKRQTPFIEKAMELWGVKQIRSPLLEADDLAAHFTRVLKPNHKVTLVSGDKDWLQLVQPGVTWYDPIRDRRCSHSTFLEFTGYFDTDAFVHGKALQGDGTDNIDGIDGIGEGTAQKLLAKFFTVHKFFAAVDAGTYTPATRKSKTAKSLHPEQVLASPEGRAIFERNIKLMDLRNTRKPEQGECVINKGKPDPAALSQLLSRLAFMSILRDFDAFMAAPVSKPFAEVE